MKKNLLAALKRTPKTPITKWLFGSIGGLIAILLAFKNFQFTKDVLISVYVGGGLIITLYLTRFVLFFSQESYKTYAEKRKINVFGDAIIILNAAFARLHWLRKHEKVSDQELLNTMRLLCQQLKVIFDKITGTTTNSVSIKVPVKGSDEISWDTEVKNLARDTKSHIQRDTDTYKEAVHKISSNTCFYELLNQLVNRGAETPYYLNNNIENASNYSNTSKDCYGDGSLAYKSELVVPIIPIHRKDSNDYTIAGFLCLDNAMPDVYDGNYDLAILQGVADGMYDLIKPNMLKIKIEDQVEDKSFVTSPKSI